ncbi:MAG: toprim domain-containing protein [Nanoarchaeota archaeon]
MDCLEGWLMALRSSRKLIVVEGKKDAAALAQFGIPAIPLNRRPLFSFAEDIAARTKDCVILTDLDTEGKRLYAMLKEHLTRNGVRIDTQFREWLFRETTLRQIEGLVSYAEKEEKKKEGKLTPRQSSDCR